MKAIEKAELLFEKQFRENMKGGHVGQFKTEYSTLYRKVILPLMAELIQENDKLKLLPRLPNDGKGF